MCKSSAGPASPYQSHVQTRDSHRLGTLRTWDPSTWGPCTCSPTLLSCGNPAAVKQRVLEAVLTAGAITTAVSEVTELGVCIGKLGQISGVSPLQSHFTCTVPVQVCPRLEARLGVGPALTLPACVTANTNQASFCLFIYLIGISFKIRMSFKNDTEAGHGGSHLSSQPSGG